MSLNIRLNGQTVSLKEFTTSSPEYNLCPIKIPYRKNGNTYYALAAELQSDYVYIGAVGSLNYFVKNTDPTMKIYKNGKINYFCKGSSSSSSAFRIGTYTKHQLAQGLYGAIGEGNIRQLKSPCRIKEGNTTKTAYYLKANYYTSGIASLNNQRVDLYNIKGYRASGGGSFDFIPYDFASSRGSIELLDPIIFQ